MRHPVVDIALCTQCMGCVELAASVFRLNAAAGYIAVIELPHYPASLVDEAIKFCPVDAISWEE